MAGGAGGAVAAPRLRSFRHDPLAGGLPLGHHMGYLIKVISKSLALQGFSGLGVEVACCGALEVTVCSTISCLPFANGGKAYP